MNIRCRVWVQYVRGFLWIAIVARETDPEQLSWSVVCDSWQMEIIGEFGWFQTAVHFVGRMGTDDVRHVFIQCNGTV